MTRLAPPGSQRLGIGNPDPPLADDPGGGDDFGWVTLTRASNDIEAHLITGRLDDSGIESTLTKEPSFWAAAGHDPWAPVTVLVRKIQFEDARIVLAEVAMESPSAEPSLGTPRRGRSRGPVIWWAAAIGLGLLFTALSYVGAQEAAERCRASGECSLPSEGR